MNASRTRERHLETGVALDFLEQRLDEAGRRRVEEHLARPCSGCRERVRSLGELLETMREDRVGPVPVAFHRRAVELFAPAERPSLVRTMVDAIAELLFDSASQPLSAAARRSVGAARRVRFKLGTHSLDVEIERESASTMSVRGRIIAPEAHLWTMTVDAGTEHRVVHPDATGSFVLDGLPLAPLSLQLRNADERFRIPTLEP